MLQLKYGKIGVVMEELLKQELEKIYKDKKVTQLIEKDRKLYYLINEISKKHNLKLGEYLEKIGFEYIRKPRESTIEFDCLCGEKLCKEFNVTQTKLGGWLDVTRSEISRRFKSGGFKGNWETKSLSDIEIDLIKIMINENRLTFDDDELTIAIRNNGKNCCVIIVENQSKVKVIFEFNDELQKLFFKYKLNMLNEEELHLLTNLESEIIYCMGKKVVQPSALNRQKINNFANKKELDVKQYVNILGFDDIVDAKVVSDSNIREILSKYVVEENFLYFPSSSGDYAMINTRASRSDLENIDKYIEFFGFKKLDYQNIEIDKKRKEYVEQIKNYIVELPNLIYLDTQENFYKSLYYFLKRQNMTIDEFLNKNGYQRTYNKQEVKFVNFEKEIEKKDVKIHLLNELKEIQGKLDKELKENIITKRNQELVEKLKELYDNKCQLCGGDINIPIIEMENGKSYVEVHHIEALSNEDSVYKRFENVDKDSYKNTIVVCPFHHKALHLHHGGYKKIIRKKDKLFFESNQGSLIKIVQDFHLSEFY